MADAIAARDLDGVAVRSVTQLTPELALDVAGRDVVVFVDASVGYDVVTVRDLDAGAPAPGVMTHHADPAAVLAMVPTVGDPPAHAYVVSVPASNLDVGTEVSRETGRAVGEAVEIVVGIVTGAVPRR